MELVVEPDLYSPSINENGNYIDKIPSFHIIKKGLSCPCGSRRDKIYDTHAKFTAHIKSNHHQEWLNGVNKNRENYYSENVKMSETIKNQKLIIAQMSIKMERDMQLKDIIIDSLTHQIQLHKNKIVVENLIDL